MKPNNWYTWGKTEVNNSISLREKYILYMIIGISMLLEFVGMCVVTVYQYIIVDIYYLNRFPYQTPHIKQKVTKNMRKSGKGEYKTKIY